MSNFSFSHIVFRRNERKNQGLFGKGLIATFQLLSAASLNLGQSQSGVSRNGLNIHVGSVPQGLIRINLYLLCGK